MDVTVERVAGIDVAKAEVVVALRVPGPNRTRVQEVRTHAAFTSSLASMADWLMSADVGLVVMESTGQYWKPVWNVLVERNVELMLVNARHVKMVPGRKTDVNDAAWLAELAEHGLLRGSFVPPPAIARLRDLTRYRRRLIQTRTAERQRVEKVLEDTGIKLDLVASDLFGVSGTAMLRASSAASATPPCWPTWRNGRCARRSRCWSRRSRAASASTTP